MRSNEVNVMVRTEWICRGALSLGLLCAANGCKKDAPIPFAAPVGDEDAGGGMDGGAAGGASGDNSGRGGANANQAGQGAGGHAGQGSGGNLADAAADGDDAGVDAGPACAVGNDGAMLELPVSFQDETGYSVALGTTGFGVAYQAAGCGQISALPVASLGAFRDPALMYDQCSVIAGLSLLHAGSGWRMVWIDNSAGSAELQSALLPEALDLPPTAATTRVTNNSLGESHPQLAQLNGAAYLAWLSVDSTSDSHEILLKALDPDGDPVAVLPASLNRKPINFALGQLGTDQGAIAFVEEQTPNRGAWLLPLDKTAHPSGDPVLLTDQISGDDSVDVATREEDGGAVLYSIDYAGAAFEVHFRRLNASGAFTGNDTRLVGGEVQGRDASLARLGGGYVVAYRQLANASNTVSDVRLLFVTKEGNVTRDATGHTLSYHVADADSGGGKVSVRVSTDGQLLIGFLDSSSGSRKFKIVRKRLDCAF
jgi:hypothetical protein